MDNHDVAKSRIALAALVIGLEGLALYIYKTYRLPKLEPWEWIALAFAASLAGASIAYLYVGDWIRWPFTVVRQHPSGNGGSYVDPKHTGWLEPLGVLLSCPICAATWSAAGLLALLAIEPGYGRFTIYFLGAGGTARLLVRAAELLEELRNYTCEATGRIVRERIRTETTERNNNHEKQP